MPAKKRLAATAAVGEALRQPKKQKIASATTTTSKSGSTPKKAHTAARKTQTAAQSPKRPSISTVVPATPGTRVPPPTATMRGQKGARENKNTSADDAGSDVEGGAPLKQQGRSAQKGYERLKGEKGQKREKMQQHQPPSTLPMEPHAALLAELQPHHDVRILSVISSSRMEKRIKAVLEHLDVRLRQPSDNGQTTATTKSTETAEVARPAPAAAAPTAGVVLLHARASDASKMISIVEIVKRRIREGCFAEESSEAATTADTPTERRGEAGKKKQTKKQKQKQKQRSAKWQTAWYQYNRLYDVENAARGAAANGANHAADSEDEDDGFEPMPRQFQEALPGKHGPSTSTTTYMSIILSRAPLPALERHPDITAQASDDPIEMEYQAKMSSMT